MIRRLFLILLSIIVVSSVFPSYSKAATDSVEDADIAYFYVNEEGIVKSEKMSIEAYPNIKPKMIERDGKKGIWIANSGGDQITDLYLSVAEDFAFKVEDGTEFIVEIDYFAMDTSLFYCNYDSQEKSNKSAGLGQYLIGVDDVFQWKTMSFNLSDAYFGDRLGYSEHEEYDIDINTGQAGSILVNAVRVKKIPKQNKLYVTNLKTVNVGGLFADNEKQNFYFDVINTTNRTQTEKLFYRVVTEDGLTTVWSGEGEVTVEPHGTKRVDATAECNRFGIYYLEAGIKGDGFVQKDFVPFSLVDVIDDGTKNKNFGWGQMFMSVFDPSEQLAVAKRSNAGFVRVGIGWEETVTGSKENPKYELPPDVVRLMLDCKNEGMGFVLNIACNGNKLFDGVGGNRMPVDEYLREPYLKFIDFFAKEVKRLDLDVYGWEFWNEPNLSKFNTNMATGTEYGELAKDVADKIHETFPDATVYNGSLTGLSAQSTKDFYGDMLKTGIGDYANGISLHSYSHHLIPEVGCIQDIQDYLEEFEEYYGYKPKTSCTELGYVTQPKTSGSLVTDDLTLAKFNTRQFIYMNALHLFDNYAWYMLCDAGTNKKSMEHVFGQTEVGWKDVGGKLHMAAKESFVAITAMNKLLQNAECEKTVADRDNTYAYIFRRPKDNALVMPVWTSADARTFSFKCDADVLTLYDMYGNAEKIYGHNGVFSISAIDEVQYLEGNLNHIELCTHPVELSSTDIIAAVDNEMPVSLMASGHNGMTAEMYSSSPEFAIIQSKADFTNSGAVLSFQTSHRIGAKTRLTINVKQDGKLIYKWQIPVELSDEVSLLATTNVTGSSDVWGMEVKLSNHSTVPIRGTISIVSPAELANSYDAIEFETIPAGRTGELMFKPSKIEGIGLYPAVFRIETSTGKVFELGKNLDFSVANYATVKPRIDGYINEDEWDFASKLRTIYEEQVVFGVLYSWTGINDLSAETMIKYDEDNFYMAVDAKDDTHVPLPVGTSASNIWMYDSMQFGISFERYMTDDVQGGTFTEISFGETYNGTWVYRGMSERNNLPQKQLNDDVVDCVVRREGTHTYYEIRIPWSEITVLDLDFDTLDAITFSMLINDNDGNGRKGWMEYGSGIGMTKDVTQFTSLQLIK